MPKPAPEKPKGRSLADFQPLRAAEEKLLAACAAGELAQIGNDRPTERTDDNCIRADFLRFLALGGDEQAPIHERGVQLWGAWIEGEFDLDGASVPRSLALPSCHFDTTLALRDAKIAGPLNLGGCHVPGIKGDRLSCNGDLFLRTGFGSSGEIRLLGAQIGGALVCGSASLDGKEGFALSADRAVIKGSVFLNKDFKASGEVRLLGAQIGGALNCDSANLDGKKGHALSADGAVIKGDVFLNEAFKASGTVRLPGAQIGGDLACSSANLDGKKGDAFSADGAVIKGDVFLNEAFKASGTVRLLGTQIGGDLNCDSASLDGKEGFALSTDGAVIQGSFFFHDLEQAANKVTLASCHVGRLVDDSESWGENIVLDGFSYDHIAGSAPTDAATRLAWLAKQCNAHHGTSNDGADFKPQPWQQLIHVLRTMGHEEDARQVAIEREVHLRKVGRIGQTPKAWSRARAWPYRAAANTLHWLFGLLIAYGYRPIRLLAWMLLTWALAGAGYWAAAEHGIFAPSNPLVFDHPAYAHCRPDYKPESSAEQTGSPRRFAPRDDSITLPKHGNWFTCPELAGEYTGFSPMLYSLDLILPLVDLQQEQDWAPIIPTPKATWHAELFQLSWNHATRWLLWFEILFGWVASLLLVAVLTGLTNRDKD